MKTGGASTSRWEPGNDRDPRRNSYPPPAHVTAYGQSRFSSPGPWPRQRPSYYSNTPGGYNPYQRDSQQRHTGNRSVGHSQYDSRESPYASNNSYGRSNSYAGRDNRYGGESSYSSGGSYGSREHNDPRRRSTGVSFIDFLHTCIQNLFIITERKMFQSQKFF